MKIIIFSIVGLVFTSLFSVAQTSNYPDSKRIKYVGTLGVARSTFNVGDIPSSPNYQSLELRLGVGIVKPMGSLFEIRTGLSIGLKMKRDSYFFGPSKQYTNEPGVVLRLDEAASNRNHFVLGVPLYVQFNPLHSKMGFSAGFNGRFWIPNNDDVDVLTNMLEVGFCAGLSRRITPRIGAGLDFYFGLTDFYYGGFIAPGSSNPIPLKVTNQYQQLTIEYFFN